MAKFGPVDAQQQQQQQQQQQGSNHATYIDIPNIDGKASVEQQVEIHVHDLFDVKDNASISLEEVLEGLRYVMDFRIKGGFQHHLDKGIMKRLCEALLLNTSHTEGNLLRKRPTPAADMAFFLFGDFLEQVVEFRAVVGEKDVFELRNHLKIHYRCRASCSEKQKRGTLALVQLLTTFFPQHITDWRDLVKESEQSDMEQLLQSPWASEISVKETSKMPQSVCKVSAANNTTVLPPPQALYFDRPVEKLLRMFSYTHPENGLPSALVPALREQYGSNKLPDPPRPSAVKMLWAQLTDFMVLLLLAAATIQAGQQEFNSMAVLLVVVVLNTTIGFSQEWKAHKTLSALLDLSVPKARVIRDGEQQMLDSDGLVPGDLVVLDEGDAVPADIRLIQVAQLEIIESILTGESLPVAKKVDVIKAKSRRIPLGDCLGNAFMSTTIARGHGKGIVVRTGEQTEIGKISSAIQAGSKHKAKTPIQRRLSTLGKVLVLIAILLCALVVIIGVAWKRDAVFMVNIGISLAVSVIPEGLVAVTTVTMALGVRRMAQNQCLVRTLPAVESLGSVTVICSDKTGTLTEGKMGVTELWTADNTLYRFTESTSLDPAKGEIVIEPAELRRRMIHMRRSTILEDDDDSNKEEKEKEKEEAKPSSAAAAPSGSAVAEKSNSATPNKPVDYAALRSRPIDRSSPQTYLPLLKYALMVSALCNNASVTFDEEAKIWQTVGDPTEIALAVASQKANIGKNYWTDQQGYKRTFERAFDSERKLMSTLVQSETSGDAAVLLCKGAPEELLRKCCSYMVEINNGGSAAQEDKEYRFVDMTSAFATCVSDESTRMASQGLRVLGLAIKHVSSTLEKDLAEDQLVFIGLVGLIDPPKEGVRESVELCQKAGIRVTMITGDHVKTAVAIASKLGIFQANVPGMCRAILGRELDLLSEDAIIELDPFPNVFARVSPDNKLMIVKALQQRGELVAMTGDGVNDAPAIKRADVGVAMGQAGTEITKQAADLVLLNDNFTTIVAAVEEGRHVFDNILKFIVYLLSCNGSEIFIMLICTIAGLPPPFTTMMILWGNVIADIPPAMALGVEPKETTLMQRAPRDPKIHVVTKGTWIVILMQSLVMAVLSLGSYLLSLHWLSLSVIDSQSMTFVCITMIQLIHSFLSRSVQESVFKTGILSNQWMIVAAIISLGLLLLGVYAPGISTWLELTYVGWQAWVVIIVCCIIHTVIVEIEKFIVRRFEIVI